MDMITSSEELKRKVLEYGLLPMFSCPIKGFSLEDMVPRDLWFKEGVVGPWEWREDVAAEGRIAYSKCFRHKAGFISMDYYPHFLNARRRGMDYEERYEAGLMNENIYTVIRTLETHLPMLSPELRAESGLEYKTLTKALSDAMMMGYVTIAGFRYKTDKNGNTHGWGVGIYDLCDRMYGPWAELPDCPPEMSAQILIDRVRELSGCTEIEAERLLRG